MRLIDYCSVACMADYYKTGHQNQYPDKTTLICSNYTPRISRLPHVNDVVVYGYRHYIRQYLMDYWASFIKDKKFDEVDEFEREVRLGLNAPNYSADHFRNLINLGYMPLEIKALPEGESAPIRVPYLTLHNTHPDFHWLTNFIETQMSAETWKMCTAATIAREYRRTFEHYATRTHANRDIIPFQGHDFSMRGMSGVEDAAKCGSAHLLSFLGTDTLPAIRFLRKLYGAQGFIGGSVPATEHSVMQSGLNDLDTITRLLDIYPTGILSVVCDTWDFWHVVTEILPALKDKIMTRDGKLVIRPDSGDPVKILCGDPEATTEHEKKGLIEVLWNIFGGTTNDVGFRTLDSHIGAIYGDSITLDRQSKILHGLFMKDFASDNVVLGIGSYTYQYVTRDTFGFALKATHATIDGEHIPLYKDPKTDNGTKKSAKGLICVLKENGIYRAEEVVSWNRYMSSANHLKTVYKDGVEYNIQTIEDIKSRLDFMKLV